MSAYQAAFEALRKTVGDIEADKLLTAVESDGARAAADQLKRADESSKTNFWWYVAAKDRGNTLASAVDRAVRDFAAGDWASTKDEIGYLRDALDGYRKSTQTVPTAEDQRVKVLSDAIAAIEDPEQRRAASGGDSFGWESARDVLNRLLRKATSTP